MSFHIKFTELWETIETFLPVLIKKHPQITLQVSGRAQRYYQDYQLNVLFTPVLCWYSLILNVFVWISILYFQEFVLSVAYKKINEP